MLSHPGYFLPAKIERERRVSLISLLFGFKGRINRVQYWYGCIGAGVAGAMLMFLLALLLLPQGEVPKTTAGIGQMLSYFGVVIGVPLSLMGWATLALQTKRTRATPRSRRHGGA